MRYCEGGSHVARATWRVKIKRQMSSGANTEAYCDDCRTRLIKEEKITEPEFEPLVVGD